MAKTFKIPPEFEPRVVSISFTMEEDGTGQYRTSSQANAGARIKTETWGYARPECRHLRCRWINLSRAAREWGELAVPYQGGSTYHGEQLGLLYPEP